MPCHFRYRSLTYLSVAVAVMLICACSGSDTSVDPEGNVGAGGATDPDADSSGENAFQKPPPPDDDERGTHEFFEGQPIATPIVGRDHMHWTRGLVESWLYTDEYFVRDGYVAPGGLDWPTEDYQTRTFEVFVLCNGEQLPMRFVEVHDEDGFPSMDEIESWERDDYTNREVFNLASDTSTDDERLYLNYTLVVPPWAFPEKGAYNIQVLFVPVWEPFVDKDRWGHIQSQFPSFTSSAIHTVFYGSEEFQNPELGIDDFQERADTWEDDITAQYAHFTQNRFLAPPTEIYDWTDVDSHSDAELAEVLEVSETEVTLELFVVGNFIGKGLIGNDNHLYYVYQDGDIVDTFWYEVEELAEEPFPGTADPGERIPIDVQLPHDQSETTVQVFSALDPLEPMPPIGDRDTHINMALQSNALILRYVPDDKD